MMLPKQIAVAGAVIVKDGEILCAQRGDAGTLAGWWEFPGGKIEPGETPEQALLREISEELRCTIRVGEWITTTTHEYDFGAVTLSTYYCELRSDMPSLTEHAAARWLPPHQLGSLPWAPADVPTVQIIAEHGLPNGLRKDRQR